MILAWIPFAVLFLWYLYRVIRGWLRLNDGKADRWGRLWFGSMHNRMVPPAQGCLYRWQAGEAPAVVETGYGVANGPAISPDGSRLYQTDSPRRTIYVFDLAPDGALTNKRVWLTFERDEGFLDGMNFDADGHLWIAHWGGALRDAARRSGAGAAAHRPAGGAGQQSGLRQDARTRRLVIRFS